MKPIKKRAPIKAAPVKKKAAPKTHRATRNKRKGADYEIDVQDWLRTHGFPFAERRRLQGVLDKGDMGGIVDACNMRWVIECKNVNKVALAEFTQEAVVEMINDNAHFNAVFIRRRGTTDVGKSYVVIDAKTFTTLLSRGDHS